MNDMEQQKRVNRLLNVAVWLWNVFSAVIIIFVVKQLMRSTASGGLGFNYATSLTAMHYSSCALFTYLFQRHNNNNNKATPSTALRLPLVEKVIFVLINDASIGFLTLSLLLNPIFIYQVMKLCIVPFVAFVEFFYFHNKLGRGRVMGISIVLVGIFFVLNPLESSYAAKSAAIQPTFGGMLAAVCSVVSAGLQQISCRVLQKKYNASPIELLDSISVWVALSLGCVGPMIDYSMSGKWIWDYDWNSPAIQYTLASCVLAVSVNLSQFIFLGRMPATTFQVVGHVKTILVLVGGCLFFNEVVQSVQWFGTVIAILGMVLYSSSSASAATSQAPTTHHHGMAPSGGSIVAALDLDKGSRAV